jgi:hypothetical protein
MKSVDLESTIVAGFIGAAILWGIALAMSWTPSCPACIANGTGSFQYPLAGFAVGAGVQIGVRLIGVS